MNSLSFKTFNCFNVLTLIVVVGSFLNDCYGPLFIWSISFSKESSWLRITVHLKIKVQQYLCQLVMLHCIFSSSMLLSSDMVSFHILSKWLCLKLKRLFHARVVPLTTREFALAVMKSLMTTSDELLLVICWRSVLLGILY